MSESTIVFIYLGLIALSRLIIVPLIRLVRSRSAASARATRQRRRPARRGRLNLHAYVYIPGGLLAALERVDRDGEPWASLPPGDRDPELEGLLEWIVNAKRSDVLEIVSEIRRHYYNTGDKEGGDALKQALRKSLKATSMTEREAILARYEPYTREPRLPSLWIEEVSDTGEIIAAKPHYSNN